MLTNKLSFHAYYKKLKQMKYDLTHYLYLQEIYNDGKSRLYLSFIVFFAIQHYTTIDIQ